MKSSVLGSLGLGMSGSVPLILAQSTPAAPTVSGVTIPVWALSLLATFAMGVTGYLLKRSLEQVDRSLEKLDARMGRVENQVHAMENKLSK